MIVTTKELRLNLQQILSQVTPNKGVQISYGKGKNKQLFYLSLSTPSSPKKTTKNSKTLELFQKISNQNTPNPNLKIQNISQSDFVNSIKNMYD